MTIIKLWQRIMIKMSEYLIINNYSLKAMCRELLDPDLSEVTQMIEALK